MIRPRPSTSLTLAVLVCGAGGVAGCSGSSVSATTATTATPTAATGPAATTATVATTAASTTAAATSASASTPATTARPSGGQVDTSTFVTDVQDFAQALTQFGLTLQSAAEGPAALKARSATMRAQIDAMDAVVARMAGYTVNDPAMEERRASIVAAAPDVSRLGRKLLDAAEAGDSAAVQSTARDFMNALNRMKVASGG